MIPGGIIERRRGLIVGRTVCGTRAVKIVRRVIRNNVQNDFQSLLMRRIYKINELLLRAKMGIC